MNYEIKILPIKQKKKKITIFRLVIFDRICDCVAVKS